jgi:Flp pilus assembly protein TadG
MSRYSLKIDSSPSRATTCRASARSRGRSAAVVLEVLLSLPLLLIALLAIIEFGLLWSNMQAVEMAARSGSQVASRELNLPVSGNVPTDVRDAVAEELKRIGVVDYRIRIDHNVTYSPSVSIGPVRKLETTVGAGLSSVPDPAAAVNLTPNRTYVRVIVYVNTVGSTNPTGLAPNLMQMFGVDFTNHVSQASEVRRYAY